VGLGVGLGDGVGVGLGDGVGVGLGVGVGDGAGAGGGAGAASCVTEWRSSAIVTFTSLEDVPAFAATTTLTLPLPVPDAGDTLTQAASAPAVQPQALCVRTSTCASPPWLPRDAGRSPTS
jgi:hypothetical protein